MASRPSKRPKLDGSTTHQSSPAATAKPGKTPITCGKPPKSPPVPTKSSLDPSAEWLAAKQYATKLRSQPRKKKEPLVGADDLSVYDDFEGAHRGGNPWAAWQRGSAGTSNSLSNQRAAGESPQKATSSAALGIFKKFATSRESANVTEPTGTSRGGSAGREQDSKTPGVRAVGQGRGWITAAGPPKKTFEDEMREIQEKAKQQTKEDNSEDELAQESGSMRAAARKTRQRVASARTTAAKSTKMQPLDRRKDVTSRDVPLEIPESDQDDRMDVDQPDGFSTNETEVEPADVRRVARARAVPAKVLTTPKKTATKPTSSTIATAQSPFEDHHLHCIQRIVLEKATRKRPIPLVNLEDEYVKVATVIGQTISAGESNSMLVIGARGSGKTAMINQIIRDQSRTHADEFHTVRLSGFIHTDDKIALREIWRQLGREMEFDDDEATSKNYADTMARLLALLSHPAENGIETNQVTKSIIFILDEFELFAGHPRQTLLYNLFDIAQSRKAPIAVLGLTTRIDVVESLEKRVKSRFSHRYVHLGLSKSLNAFGEICRCAMAIAPKELTDEESKTFAQTSSSTSSLAESAGTAPAALRKWNTVVDDLLASETCQTFLQRLFYSTKSVPEFLATLTLALATLPQTEQTAHSTLIHLNTSFGNAAALQPPDSKLSLLHALSTLQLALLVCAARLTNVFDTEVVSFALVYEEYKVLASKSKLQASASGAIASARVWGKNVARNAWEELINVGLILEDGRSVGTRGTGRVDVGLEELGGCGVELGGWGKWCREI